MSTQNTFQYPQQAYAQAVGATSTGGVVLAQRDPTTNDVNYKIGQQWQNTTAGNLWYLNAFTSTGGILQADWNNIGTSGTPIDSIVVQTGTTPVVADGSGEIVFNGAVVAAGTNPVRTDGTGANTLALEVQISQAIAATDATKIGLSNFNSAHFSLDANGFVSLIGGGEAIDSIGVDAAIGPGTNPVLPTALGLVTVTGGQVAAGTTTNVIRTDSLAANTYTIEIQRSQAVATTTIGDNGVCHFNSAMFAVDANGFVSALAQSFNYTNVNFAASPYTVLTTDYYISVDSSGGAVTLNFPNAPTAKKLWIVKDRTGNAATNAITLTTPGVTVTFDGLTSYTMNSNYQAVNLLANAVPTYEVY